MTERPPPTQGLRHVALRVVEMEACEHFYVQLMGMQVEWRPDPDNLYLCSGSDNLALHRVQDNGSDSQHLDHLGFIVELPEHVDRWHEFLAGEGVSVQQTPKTHRDGARSCYVRDPDGNSVQILYHPPISGR